MSRTIGQAGRFANLDVSPDMAEILAMTPLAYPCNLIRELQPDRLAVIARLSGLAAPDIATARVLDIGGGDGANVIALASAWPRASFVCVDLDAEAVARGQARIAQIGLDNVRVEQGDIIDLAENLAGSFDYIFCHGVYAWVPPVVQSAILRLMGRVLVPEGVAYLSYNALPGGRFRLAIRDMLLRETQGLKGEAKIAAAKAFLRDYAAQKPGDRPVQTLLREVAAVMRDKTPAVLFHDELGPIFDPQPFYQVANAAREQGLDYINEVIPEMPDDEKGDDIETVIRIGQHNDEDKVRFFRRNVFVRSGRNPHRAAWAENLGGLHVSSQLSGDSLVAHFLEQAWPNRLPAEMLPAMEVVRLFDEGLADLHTTDAPYATEMPDRPRVHPLALAELANGAAELTTLDHSTDVMLMPEPRALISWLDGTLDRTAIEARWLAEGGVSGRLQSALEVVLRARLIMRE